MSDITLGAAFRAMDEGRLQPVDNDTMVAVTPEIAACPFGHPFVAKYPRSAVQRVVWARGYADRYKVMCECGAEGPHGDTQKDALAAWNTRHQSGRTGAGERETVARVIHQCLRPVNMANADWDSGAILGANNSWRRSVYSTADHILAALSQSTAGEDALREAAQMVLATATDHYTARNGRRCSIEGDDGEKCWIVPFDQFEDLRRAVERASA